MAPKTPGAVEDRFVELRAGAELTGDELADALRISARQVDRFKSRPDLQARVERATAPKDERESVRAVVRDLLDSDDERMRAKAVELQLRFPAAFKDLPGAESFDDEVPSGCIIVYPARDDDPGDRPPFESWCGDQFQNRERQ